MESIRRHRSVISVTFGRWDLTAVEACGLLKYKEKSPAGEIYQAETQEYISVSTTFISAALHMLPMGKVWAQLVECANRGHVWLHCEEGLVPVQPADKWSWCTKSLALVRFVSTQPIPFLVRASTSQVVLLYICIVLIVLECLCTHMRPAAEYPPEKSINDMAQLNNAFAKMVSRGMSMVFVTLTDCVRSCGSYTCRAIRSCVQASRKIILALCACLGACLTMLRLKLKPEVRVEVPVVVVEADASVEAPRTIVEDEVEDEVHAEVLQTHVTAVLSAEAPETIIGVDVSVKPSERIVEAKVSAEVLEAVVTELSETIIGAENRISSL